MPIQSSLHARFWTKHFDRLLYLILKRSCEVIFTSSILPMGKMRLRTYLGSQILDLNLGYLWLQKTTL